MRGSLPWRLSIPVYVCAFLIGVAGRAQGVVNVTDARFGAASRTFDDPLVDDTLAFQKAIDAQSAKGGGMVNVPPGIYWFNGTLTIPNNIVLSGETPGPFDPSEMTGKQDPSNTPIGAAVLVIRGVPSSEAFIRMSWYNSCVQNLFFIYAGQASLEATSPTPMAPTIRIERGAARVVGCSFMNSYVAIDVRQGRVLLHDLNIGAFAAGVVVDGAGDTVRIDTVTIHPFYRIWTGRVPKNRPGKIEQWVFENGYGIISKKVDNLQLRDVMALSRFCGLRLEASAQGATFGNASGLQFDSVQYGIIASATNPGAGFFVADSYIDSSGGGPDRKSRDGIVLIHDQNHPGTSRLSFTGGLIVLNGFEHAVYVNPNSGTLETTGVTGVADGIYRYPENASYPPPAKPALK